MRATLSVAYLFFLGKNRCETDLCSKQMGGEIHQMTVSKNAMMHCVSKFKPNGKGNATILTVWLRCFWCHPVTIRPAIKHPAYRKENAMPRLSQKAKREWRLFLDSRTGRRSYNELCRRCTHSCKQSFRAIVVACPHYESKRSTKC